MKTVAYLLIVLPIWFVGLGGFVNAMRNTRTVDDDLIAAMLYFMLTGFVILLLQG